MIAITPRLTEKAYVNSLGQTYVFRVPMDANKAQIIEAVEKTYEGVKVKDVRTIIIKGKPVRALRGKRQAPGQALRTKVKKAYVSLSEGSIELFKEEKEEA